MKNWPQLTNRVALVEYEAVSEALAAVEPRTHHPQQVYSPIGGHVTEEEIQSLIDVLTGTAKEFGYPGDVSGRTRVLFDRVAARKLLELMQITWADAGNPRIWSFVSLVALPHLTRWRFGTGNEQRWIASDLTRHTWARLWWQATVFRNREDLLDELSESDLNQLLERRVIGGDPRLALCLAEAILGYNPDVKRRTLIRDVTKRMRRRLAFIDALALTGGQLQELCTELVSESGVWLDGEGKADQDDDDEDDDPDGVYS